MDLVDLGDLEAGGVHRVQRRHRLLEDHRDAVAADGPHLGGGSWRPGPRRGTDLPATTLPGCGDEAEDGERGHALAAARLAHQAEDLAAVDPQVDAVHRLHHAVAGEVVGGEAVDLEEGGAVGAHRFSLGSRASRRPSPRRLKARTFHMMARPGKNTRWGAVKTWLRSDGQHRPPLGGGRPHPEAQEGEGGDLEDGGGHAQSGLHHEGGERVGEDAVPDDAGGGDAQGAVGGHVVVLPHGEHRRAHDAGVGRDGDDGDGQHGVDQPLAHDGDDGDGQEQ